jgi:phosphoglycolate phosphatase-like HAD superfamily hydrolase
LHRLRNSGWSLFLSTDNPQLVAETLAKSTQVEKYFCGILGCNSNDKSHKVAKHVKVIAKKLKISPKDFKKHFVYFGDSKTDMINAKKIGIIGIGRTTSYSAKEMKEAGAKKIVYGTGVLAKLCLMAYLRD